MRVSAEALPCFNHVVVNHAQRGEAHKVRLLSLSLLLLQSNFLLVQCGFCDEREVTGYHCDGSVLKFCSYKCKQKSGKYTCEYEKTSETSCSYGCVESGSFGRCMGPPCVFTSGTGSCSARISYRVPPSIYSNSATIDAENEQRISTYLNQTNAFSNLSNATNCVNELKSFVCTSKYPKCETPDAYSLNRDSCNLACNRVYWCFQASSASASLNYAWGPFPITTVESSLSSTCNSLCGSAAKSLSSSTTTIWLVLVLSIIALFSL